jgi:hypothetical protein
MILFTENILKLVNGIRLIHFLIPGAQSLPTAGLAGGAHG